MMQFDPNELEFIKRKYGTQILEDIITGKIESLGFSRDELLKGYDDYLNELKNPEKNALNQRLNQQRKLIAKTQNNYTGIDPSEIILPDISNTPQLVIISENEIPTNPRFLNDPGTQPYSGYDYGRDITKDEFMDGVFSDPSIMFRHYPPENPEQDNESEDNPKQKGKRKLVKKSKSSKKKTQNKKQETTKVISKKQKGETKEKTRSTKKSSIPPARIDNTDVRGFLPYPVQRIYIEHVRESNHPGHINTKKGKPEPQRFDGGTYDGGGADIEW